MYEFEGKVLSFMRYPYGLFFIDKQVCERTGEDSLPSVLKVGSMIGTDFLQLKRTSKKNERCLRILDFLLNLLFQLVF